MATSSFNPKTHIRVFRYDENGIGHESIEEAMLSRDDPADLEKLKAVKNAEINAARLAANRNGFMFDGALISTDELSRGDIDGTNGIVALTGEFPEGWPGFWKATDNSHVPIPDIETWKRFYAAMSAQGTKNFATAQALKAQLAAATAPDQVREIAWPNA